MKYLKRIDELFDDEEMRSKFSHEYLSGDLGPEDVNKWDKYEYESLKNQLLEEVPYLNSLDFRKTGNINQFVFNEYRDGLFLLFDIQIVAFENGKYMLANYVKSLVDDKVDWSVDFIKGNKSLDEIIKLLNNNVKANLDKFVDYVKQYDIDILNDDNFKIDLN